MNPISLTALIKVVALLLVALVLTILPLPQDLLWWQPQWLLVAIILLTLLYPRIMSLEFIWLLGIAQDLLVGSVLGLHAFLLTLVGYMILKYRHRMQNFNYWQMAVFLLVLVLLYYVSAFILQGIFRQLTSYSWFWLAAVSTLVVILLSYRLIYYFITSQGLIRGQTYRL